MKCRRSERPTSDDSLHHHVNFLWAELRIHTSQQQFILPSAGCSCWTAYSANTAWDERAHFRHRALLLDLVRCTVYLYLPVHLLKFSPPCCSVWSDKSEGLLLCDGVSLQGQRLSLSLSECPGHVYASGQRLPSCTDSWLMTVTLARILLWYDTHWVANNIPGLAHVIVMKCNRGKIILYLNQWLFQYGVYFD